MAYIKNIIETPTEASSQTYEMATGDHVTGEILVCHVNNDNGSTPMGFVSGLVTIDPALDTVTYTGPDYWTNGDRVYFTATTVPGGLAVETAYYIRDLNTGAKTFKVAATAGGAAIDITSAGTNVAAGTLDAGANHPDNGWKFLFVPARNTAGSNRSGVAYIQATSSGATTPIFYGNTDNWIGASVTIPEANITAWASAVAGTHYSVNVTGATGTTVDNATLTTDTDGCLLLYFALIDGGGSSGRIAMPYPYAAPNIYKYSGDTSLTATGFFDQQQSAGAAPTYTLYKNAASAVTYIVVAIPNATGGSLQAIPRFTASQLLWYGSLSANHDPALTWSNPAAMVGATLNGIVCSSTTATVTVNANFGGYGGSHVLTSAENATLSESPAGSGVWVGGWHSIAASDLTGKIIGLTFANNESTVSVTAGREGNIIVFGDGTNWAAFQLQNKATGWSNGVPNGYFIAAGNGNNTPYASSGTLNWSAITRIGVFTHRVSNSTQSVFVFFRNLLLIEKIALTGGGSTRPINAYDLFYAQLWAQNSIADVQGTAQALGKTPLQIGNGGVHTTYFDAEASSFEFPRAWSANTPTSQNRWNVAPNNVTFSIKAGANDTIKLSAGVIASDTQQAFLVDPASSTSASYSYAGMSIVGLAPTFKTGIDTNGATFAGCGKIDAKGSQFNECLIKGTTSADAAIAWDTNSLTITGTEIDLTDTSADYHMELGASITAITLNGVIFTGTPGVDKIHSLLMSGTLTITADGTGTTLAPTDVTFPGGSTATAVIASPTLERGQVFSGQQTGAFIRVVESGVGTQKFETLSAGASETWDDALSGTIFVDYVVQKVGFVPIRVPNNELTGSIGNGIAPVQIEQKVDRAYAASSGLAIGGGTPNVFVDVPTKKIGLTAVSTLQNLYSYLIEQWIELGNTGEVFANVPFPFEATGTNSFTLTDGWEFDLTTYPDSIANLRGDGLRYLDASRNVTAQWANIVAVGVPTGEQARFQQSDGGTTITAASTGNVDQLIQIYGDATHGNFDKRGYLVAKVQAEGYDQAEVDVVAQYGNLEDYSYTIALSPTANGLATGDPGLASPPAITDHGASPVTWNSKVFSITITDSAAGNSGEDIMRWLRYNYETGGAFQGKDGFNWHDLVQTNGAKFKTVRGAIYGDTGATLKGVRVVQNDGVTPHPDFDLFTADDNTTYSPPVTANISITGMVDAVGALNNLQIINQSAITAPDWQATTGYSLGDMVIRTSGIGLENTAGLYMRCTSAGTSAGTEPTWNTTVGGTTSDGTVTWTTYAVLYYDNDPASVSFSDTYTNGNEFLAGETFEVRFSEMNGATSFKVAHTTGLITSDGFAAVLTPEAIDAYATFGLDGSTFDTVFSPNYTSSYIVLDTNTDFTGASAFSYFCFLLTTSQGMYDFWDGMTGIDAGNIRIETDVLDLFFDETAGFVKQTDSVRIFRKDGVRPALDPTTGGSGIEIFWRVPVNPITVAGASVITGDIADVAAEVQTGMTAQGYTTSRSAKLDGALQLGQFIGLK